LVSQPLLLNYSHNTCNLNSARSFNLACLFEVGQKVYGKICKFQFTRFNVQGSTYKNSTNKNDLQASELLQPYFKSRKVLVEPASVAAYLTRFVIDFFPYDLRNARKQENYYRRATYEDNFSTCPQPRILFWFTSSSFLKRPVLLKYWLLRPFFYKEATWESSTVKGLLYAAKAVPSKDYFTHLTLKKCKKGMLSDQPRLLRVTSTALLCCWGCSRSKI
jgi:hypothetical protein